MRTKMPLGVQVMRRFDTYIRFDALSSLALLFASGQHLHCILITKTQFVCNEMLQQREIQIFKWTRIKINKQTNGNWIEMQRILQQVMWGCILFIIHSYVFSWNACLDDFIWPYPLRWYCFALVSFKLCWVAQKRYLLLPLLYLNLISSNCWC